MSAFSLISSVAGLALMLVLVGMLIRHKLYQRFPAFFAYCTFLLGIQSLEIAVSKRPNLFFMAYWLAQTTYIVLAFVAMASVLRPFTKLAYVRHPWSRFLLLPFLALVIVSCAWTAIFKPIGRGLPIDRFATAVYVFVILMSLAEVLVYVASFRVRTGPYFIAWTDQEFAILQGFGVLASINLVAYAALMFRLLHIRLDPDFDSFFQITPAFAAFGSTLVWLIAFRKPEQLPTEPSGRLPDALRIIREQFDFSLEALRELARHLGLRLAAS